MLVRKKNSTEPEPGTGRLIGYARVSTRDQELDAQINALRRAGVNDDNIWAEKVSGVRNKRPQRDLALMDARTGDTFIVTKLDRLGRSLKELIAILDGLDARGIKFRSLGDSIDTTTPVGRFMFHLLGSVAEFERGLIRDRTSDGMREAQRQGRRMGAPLFMTPERVAEATRRLTDGEIISNLAKEWKISRQTLYTRFPKKTIRRWRQIRRRKVKDAQEKRKLERKLRRFEP